MAGAGYRQQRAGAVEHAVAARGGGLHVIRASSDVTLEVVGSIDLDVEGVDESASGATAHVVGSSPAPQLIEIDLSNPASPVPMRTFDVPGDDAQPFGVVVVDHRAFIAAGDAGCSSSISKEG